MIRRPVVSLLLLPALLLLSPLRPARADAPRVAEEVRRAMQDRDYEAAVEAIDGQLPRKDVPHDYLLYLRGRARHLQDRYDEAVATFERLVEEYPESPWGRRARFAKAVSLARKGDFRAAELIYRAEARDLFSLDRKEEIAGIYLEFAEAYFDPAEPRNKPDYQKALDFFDRALQVGPRPDTQRDVELKMARCRQELGQHAEAAEAYRAFIRRHDDHPLRIEARYRLGESLLARNERVEARRVWQDLLELHRGSDSPRLAEARFQLARTYHMPEPPDEDQLNLGVAALESFLREHPEHEKASEAHLWIAQGYQHRGRHEEAVAAARRLLADERYAGSEAIPRARVLLGHALRLQRRFDEALATFRDFLARHPTDQAWSDVQRAIIDTQFLQAQAHFQDKQYDEARRLWQEFLTQHPLDARNPDILLAFGRMRFARQQWQAALEDWRRLVSKYPQSEAASQAQFLIAQTLEEKLGKLDEALKAYQALDWGSRAPHAQARIARLTARSLTISTDRIFRSDATPWLKLVTRNLETVNVRAYQVDLETYFRKMHLARGIEQLDTALIDPDRTFEFTIPGYEQYRELENRVEVPLAAGPEGKTPEAGVLAVTVSGKTREATTLLIRSDLDILVKSSRHEVFVFAQNQRTGQPWPGAKVLVSDGSRVFGEGVTGDDGVFRQEYEELQSAGDARVFAVSGGHTASNMVGLQGLGVAQGLAPKGYLYTERPAYRPGQMVHVRGIVRHVAGDTYTIAEGKKYQLEVRDNRDRLVHRGELALNAFGSCHANFLLPAASPQGQYRVSLSDEDKETYQGSFLVQDFQPQTVRLEVDTQRRVYYRGEDIEGTIRVTYYYGAPVVGREVRYQLGDSRLYSARTDQKGEIGFLLGTRDFRETQAVPLVVQLPQEGLQTTAVFQLATQGFSLAAKTMRDVYLAGESFELQIEARDAEGRGVARDVELRVLKRTRVEGKVGEVEVETHALKTSDGGTARKTLVLKEGGEYLLRLTGVDRFQNPVTTDALVRISDEEDTVRLRILAEKHTYRAGDVAKLRLHWREEPALAVVTFQGARILDYRLLELKQGENLLEVPMSSRLAPNFELAVAVMTDLPPETEDASTRKRFHHASSPFQVERELKIAVELRSPEGADRPPRPGDEVEAVITTTDPQGKPISAEVSLALIEKSLLDRFSSPLSPIQEFFRGALRQAAVRTTSSIEFSYRPETRSINRLLLADAERREVEAIEERRLEELAANATEVNGDGVVADGGRVMLGGIARGTLSAENAPSMPGLAPGMGAYGGSPNAPAKPQSLATPHLQISGEEKSQLNNWAVSGLQQDFSSAEVVDALSMWGPVNQIPLRLNEQSTNGSTPLETLYFQQGDIPALQANGVWLNVNTAKLPEAEAKQVLDELAEQNAMLLPGLRPHETAYWNPALTTDQDGTVRVTITLPERSTAWTLAAVGVTTETLAGQASDELVVKKDLFGQLKLPTALTDGDRARVEVSVHNQALDSGSIEVTLQTTIGDKTTTLRRTLEVNGRGIQELVFDQPIELPKTRDRAEPEAVAELQLTVQAGQLRDVARRSVPVKPFGMPVFSVDGGTARGDVSAEVAAPAGMPLQDPRLQIVIGPSVEQSLLAAVLAPPTWCQRQGLQVSSGIDSTSSDLLASLALQSLLAESRDAGSPQAAALDERIRSSISLLVSLQNDEGAWAWAGRSGSGDRYTTARVVWALSLAGRAGYRVAEEATQKAVTYLQSQIAQAAPADYETKAVLLHALVAAGREDFTLANQLYRNRPALSAAGLAHLALAFAGMERDQTAGELLDLLADRKISEASSTTLSSNRSETELRALYAVALEKVAPQDGRLREQVEWLMAHRTGHRWSPDKATGPAMLAVCRWYARSRFSGEKYELTVFVNDAKAGKLLVEPAARTRTIDVPRELLREGKQQIRFELLGRGEFTYQCVLGGFVSGDELRGTTKDWEVRRYYEPAPREFDGREVARGFDVLQGSYQEFRNPLTQLPVGRRGHVELHVRRFNAPSTRPGEQLEYLVVTEPLPSGVAVVESSVKGGFERFEVQPGAITFYVGNRRAVAPITYDIHGYLPGEYRAAPTVVRNAYRDDQIAVAEAGSMEILPLGGTSGDDYRLTPRELYELGKLHFAEQEYAAAGRHLHALLKDWNLKPEVYRDCVRMLLDIHLQEGPAAEVVRYFEIINEKFADLVIPFDKLLQVGDAYHEMGEYERSYLVFRATVEASFLKESQVAGFLDAQQKFLRSVEVTNDLLREYPPEPYVAAANYALAQRIYAKAPQASADAELRERKLTRVDLIRRAWHMLDALLTAHPEDPAADEASFSLANALLDLELYERTIERCEQFARRYPDSKFLDSYWYITGYCHFALGQHQAALDMCRKVAQSRRIDPASGREVESSNKWQAVYILGQIYHSLGEARKAIEEYTRVKDRFADARQAIDYFLHEAIELPEVTTVAPGEPVELRLKFRNVARCDATVYRIDLMKFSLLRRSLGGITDINLAGIRPHHQESIELGEGRDYRDRTAPLTVPVEDAGAYLIVCRADGLYTTGLVLVTSLEMEIQEESESGRVRATLRDRVTDRYVHGVHVKAIGSENQEFRSGETDLRGVFVADGLRGSALVVAQADGNYAFHRGTRRLGPPPQPAQQAGQARSQSPDDASEAAGGESDLLENLRGGNYEIQQKQQQELQRLYQNSIQEGIPNSFGGGLFK